VHNRIEKSDVKIICCEEGGRSAFVFLAKEEMLFSPLQACRGQENFEITCNCCYR